MQSFENMGLEIAKGISLSIQDRPELILQVLNYCLICFIAWIVFQLIRFVCGKIRPDVGYKTHKDAMNIIEKHLPH